MLLVSDNPHILRVNNPIAAAWIEYYPELGDELEHLPTTTDWRLWVKPGRDLPASLKKSPTRLLVESHLRAWVLRRSGRCLATLPFADLVRLTQGRAAPAPQRVMRQRQTMVWLSQQRRASSSNRARSHDSNGQNKNN